MVNWSFGRWISAGLVLALLGAIMAFFMGSVMTSAVASGTQPVNTNGHYVFPEPPSFRGVMVVASMMYGCFGAAFFCGVFATVRYAHDLALARRSPEPTGF